MTISPQDTDVFPVVKDPWLELMGEDLDRPGSVEASIVSMPTDGPRTPPMEGGKKLMDRFSESIEHGQEIDRVGTDVDQSQQEKYKEISNFPRQKKDEAYLRLTLRMHDGKMSLIQAHKVDGPLLIEDRIYGNLAYEVILSSKRIALGSIIDVVVNRSFPNPYGMPGQGGHFFAELPSYEFDVRIPAKDLSISVLPNIEIIVYEVKSPMDTIIGEKSLAYQFRSELEKASQLKGIDIQALSHQSQAEIYSLFREGSSEYDRNNND
jgi:hypothetical protein